MAQPRRIRLTRVSLDKKSSDLSRATESSRLEKAFMNQTIEQDNVADQLSVVTAEATCCTASSTTTGQFLKKLRDAKPDQQIVFQLGGTLLVEPGYHVTEVKAVTYRTMDCGGVADSWNETVIQLWNPGDEPEREHMKVKKFLAIYDHVSEHVPVSDEAELRFEYGDARRPATNYHIERLESSRGQTLVHLRAPVVTCKERDRKNQSKAAAEVSCCG
jgi:SHS2 domain-containing protein